MQNNTRREVQLVTAKDVDLTNCDRERIHIPNAIQNHGCLIVAEPDTLTIVQASDNLQDFFNRDREDILGSTLCALLDPETVGRIRGCSGDFLRINPLRVLVCERPTSASVHTHGGFLFLELEPFDPKDRNDFLSFYNITRTVIDEIQNARTFESLSEVIVRHVRSITGFDRTLVYKFDDDGSGHVIAEAKNDDLEPLLGLHYPATDVPKPARALYLLNYIRSIADVNSKTAALPPHPQTGEPFDLSHANLRSVSPIHIEYLQNMGVRASMSISLVHEGRLWGLVACHNYAAPKYVPYEVRTACEFLGKVMSLNLVSKQDRASLEYQLRIQDILATLIDTLSVSIDIPADLRANSDRLRQLVNAQGLGICFQGQIELFGTTPEPSDVIDFIQNWSEAEPNRDLLYTDCTRKRYPRAASFQDVASGAMLLYLSRTENSYIIWFRPEIVQSVRWAGNPNKDAKRETDGTLTLSPRQSFAQWQQTVVGRSRPWLPCEIQQIREFRNLLVDIIFKASDELAEINIELQRSNTELDSFAYVASHDLKEPLRGIYNYSYLLLEDYEDSLDEGGTKKLRTLMTLTKRMEKLIDTLLYYSRLGRQSLARVPVDLVALVREEIQTVLETSRREPHDIRLPERLPEVRADRVLVEKLLTNLIANGLKYNKSADKWIEIGCTRVLERSSQTVFYVRDNGIGIAKQHQELVFRIFKRLNGPRQYGEGTGAGLTIVQKIAERHGGQVWLQSEQGQGSTFYFTLSPE